MANSMVLHIRSWISTSILGALAVLCSGCADMPRPPWMASKPEESDVQISGIRDASEEIDRLEALASTAGKKDAAEQEAITLQLAQQLAAESDPIIRAAQLRALAAYPTSSASLMLKQGLQDTDKDVRVVCCEMWGKRAGPEAAKILSEVIASDTDIDVRLAAARGLGQLEDQAAVKGLALALDDPDPAMQRRAVVSLQNVTGRDYGGDIAAWRQFMQGNEPVLQTPSLAERVRSIF